MPTLAAPSTSASDFRCHRKPRRTSPGATLAAVIWDSHSVLVNPASDALEAKEAKRRLLRALEKTTRQPTQPPIGSPDPMIPANPMKDEIKTAGTALQRRVQGAATRRFVARAQRALPRRSDSFIRNVRRFVARLARQSRGARKNSRGQEAITLLLARPVSPVASLYSTNHLRRPPARSRHGRRRCGKRTFVPQL